MTQGAQSVFAFVLIASTTACFAARRSSALVKEVADADVSWGLKGPANATATADSNKGPIPVFDTYVFIYWGVVFSVMISTVVKSYLEEKGEQEEKKPDSEHLEVELAESIWSLNLVAAVGQAKFPNGQEIHPYMVGVVSVALAMAQLFTLFLIVDSMDPAAKPITTVPLVPWKSPEQSWTVNCMKWLMVTFLSMSVVPEAGDAMKEFVQALQIDIRRLTHGKMLPLFCPVLHYIITMGVVIAGVSVILSCQDVGSILYNSLAITFINGLDDTIFKFFEGVCGIDADFKIEHKDMDGDGEPDIWDTPVWTEVLERFIILFPCLYGVFLIGRAWYTGQMPSVVLRLVYHIIGY